jgi:hypothetical protein
VVRAVFTHFPFTFPLSQVGAWIILPTPILFISFSSEKSHSSSWLVMKIIVSVVATIGVLHTIYQKCIVIIVLPFPAREVVLVGG